MTRALLGLAAGVVLVAPSAALAGDDAPGTPGSTEVSLELSWMHVERFYDDDGEARPLEQAFGPDAKGVGFDAALFQFGGRYVFGPGLEAWVDVPLVRLARSGKLDSLLGDESLYAEALAMGDVSGGGRLEIPLDVGEMETAFGVSGVLKGPTGNFERIGSRELATGGGDFGAGGELFAVARPGHGEVGAAAGLLLLLPHEREGVDVDRGDVRAARAWAAVSAGPRIRVGMKVLALMREADRVDGDPVKTLSGGAQPGTLVPDSRLLSIAPFVELSPASGTRLAVSVGGPTTPWLFVPGESGWAVSGKNVLVTGAQLRVSFQAGF